MSQHSFHAYKFTSEFCRSTTLGFFEYAVEIGDVVKAAVIADLADALFGFNQPSRGVTYPGVIHIVDKGLAGSTLYESIE